MEAKKEYILMNRVTGEILKEFSAGEFYIKERGDPEQKRLRSFTCSNGKVVTPKDDDTLVYCRYKHAVIINAQEFQELSKELSTNECAVLGVLFNHISYHGNLITVGSKTRFTIEELAEICGLSKPTFIRANLKLAKEWILISTDGGRGKARQWILNPLIAHRGRYYSVATRELFRKYRVRSEGLREWGRYGQTT